MTVHTSINSYGVKEQSVAKDDLDLAVESLRLVGYAVVDSGLLPDQKKAIADAFEEVRAEREQIYGLEILRAIDEHNTIRAPLASHKLFADLAHNPRILSICERIFGEAFVLNQQNGVINPPKARYNQGAYHRDLPYQHFVSSRPLAINALYTIDRFTLENGATKVVPGSHKVEAFPSDEAIRLLQRDVEAPAGSFIILDCMTFHSGGANRSDATRRAVNHVYTLPFIKQQINLQTLLGTRAAEVEQRARLFDIDNGPAADVDDWYKRRQAHVKPSA